MAPRESDFCAAKAERTTARVVAIQHVDLIAAMEQALFELDGEGRFCCARQTGEPEYSTGEAITLGAHVAADAVLDPGDVGRLCFWSSGLFHVWAS